MESHGMRQPNQPSTAIAGSFFYLDATGVRSGDNGGKPINPEK